jgi:hypothetical protein
MNPTIAQSMRNEDDAVAAIVDAFAAAADDLPVWDSAEDELERRIRSYVNQK